MITQASDCGHPRGVEVRGDRGMKAKLWLRSSAPISVLLVGLSLLLWTDAAWAAFASGSSFCTANVSTSATSWTFATSAQLTAGNVGVIVLATDNVATTNGNTNDHSSITDAAGNTWTKAREYTTTETNAVADAATVSVWYSKASANLASGGNISVNLSGSIAAKAVTCWQFTMGAGNTIALEGGADKSDVQADAGLITLSGLPNTEHLFIRGTASEASGQSYTASTNYTAFTHTSSTFVGGATSTSMDARGEFRIFTATTDTTDPAMSSTSRDRASTMVALKEVAQAITFVGAGAAVSANNASVSLNAPAGAPSPGQLMIAYVTARGNGTLGAPAGWTVSFEEQWRTADNLHRAMIAWRIFRTNDALPTFTYTGGAANNDVIGQLAVYSGTDQINPLADLGAISNNATAQNIGPITGFTPTNAGNNGAVIVLGHRADDWTSVATLSGDGLTWVQIGAPSSTLGTDAGMVWNHAIYSGAPPTITAKTFTVTGGATNTSAGKMISIKPALITFLGVGAAAAANNASVTPALPTGLVAGDLMIAYVTARGNGTIGDPAGWTVRFEEQWYATDNLHKAQIAWRIFQTGDTAPAFTYTGGAAGDDVIGQIAAYRGADRVNPLADLGAISNNAAAQNIGPITGFTPTNAGNNGAVIVLGHKGDDWTSIAALSGDGLAWVDIGQYSSTAGNDASIVWNHAIYSGAPPTITAKTFTVTGGTSTTGAGKMISIKTAGTTIADGTNPGNTTIAPGAAATDVDAFTLQTTTGGTDTVTAVTVTLAAGTSAGINLVQITDNSNVVMGTATDPGSDTVPITLSTNISVTTTATTYKIRITPKSHANMPAPPGATYAVTATVTSFTGSNLQSGTDTASATVTIDNQSPANVTGASATPGSGQVTVSWTNPTDSDFTTGGNVVVLRNTATNTDVPAEGTAPAVDATVGTSVVRYISNGTSFIDTGLTGGTYYYRIFAKDSSGNYSTAVQVSATVSVLPPTVGEVSSVENDATSSKTWLHTTSGTNRALLVGVSWSNGVTPTSVTYAGTAMTSIGSVFNGTSARVQLFYLLESALPASGTSNTVSVTLSSNAGQLVVGAVTLRGVNQTTPVGTLASATGTSATPSVNAASNAGETVIDTFFTADDHVPTVSGGQTQQWNPGGTQGSGWGAGSTKPGASSVTMSWTTTLSAAWAIGAVGIKPVATCSSVPDSLYVTAET